MSLSVATFFVKSSLSWRPCPVAGPNPRHTHRFDWRYGQFSNFLVNFPLKTNGNSPNSKQPVCWQLHKLLHHHVRQTGSFKILYSSPFAGYCFGGWTQTLGLRPWRGWTGGRGTRVCAWVRQRDSVGWLSDKLICYGRRMAIGEILRGEYWKLPGHLGDGFLSVHVGYVY